MENKKSVTDKFPNEVAFGITSCVSYIFQAASLSMSLDQRVENWSPAIASRANDAHYAVLVMAGEFEADVRMAENAITELLNKKLAETPDHFKSFLDRRMQNIRKHFIPL